MKESAHNALWSQVAFTREGLAEGLRKTSRELLSMGITSVHDAGGYGAKTLDMMEQASRTGDLGVRVYQLLYPRLERRLQTTGRHTSAAAESERALETAGSESAR